MRDRSQYRKDRLRIDYLPSEEATAALNAARDLHPHLTLTALLNYLAVCGWRASVHPPLNLPRIGRVHRIK